MLETPPEPATKPARPLNRWGMGTLSVLQIALLAVIVIAANYLSISHYATIDLSRSADYSLSSSSLHYLQSATVRDRAKPIKWIMAFRRTSPFYERVRAMAEEYEHNSKGKITLEVVDPLRSMNRMQEVAAAYNITLVRDLIIIDARTDESPVTTENSDKTKALNPHVKLVAAEDMAVYATADGKRKVSGFQCEDVLTASLVESIEGHPRKMALLADKSRFDDKEGPSPRKSLEDTLRFQNVQLNEIHLSGLTEIPSDISGIVIAAPKYDLTDAELSVVEHYWNKPHASILVLIEAGETPPKLRAFLRSKGITPRKDRVIAREKNTLVTSARAVFTKGVPFMRDLAGQTTTFGGASSSLDVREGAEDLQVHKIYATGLVQVADGFWGETKFGQGNETFDEKEDNKPPLYIAASATRGVESDDGTESDISRMIVISNTDFLDAINRSAENLDFLASSVNWLVGRESLAGIGPRSLGTYKLPLLEAQISFINRVNLFFLPAFLLLIGGFVWTSRRV